MIQRSGENGVELKSPAMIGGRESASSEAKIARNWAMRSRVCENGIFHGRVRCTQTKRTGPAGVSMRVFNATRGQRPVP